MSHSSAKSVVGVIGGSGIYQLDSLKGLRPVDVETPFGRPSDSIMMGEIDGRTVAFLPRHGRGHGILPHEVNARANIWALKSLGVDWILSFSAVGSLKEEIRPRDVVIPDQLFDRTRSRVGTFFGNGLVAHVSVADPFCPVLRKQLIEVCQHLEIRMHDRGTYVCIEGPTFSTKAESEVNRHFGFSVVGMTALPEAKLAREAEIAYGMVALSTDYDVWHDSEEPVTVELVLENLRANAGNVQKILLEVLSKIPSERTSPAHSALKGAIMTDRNHWPAGVVRDLGPIIEPYL